MLGYNRALGEVAALLQARAFNLEHGSFARRELLAVAEQVLSMKRPGEFGDREALNVGTAALLAACSAMYGPRTRPEPDVMQRRRPVLLAMGRAAYDMARKV